MPKLQIEATELVGTRADFIALVKRGANRLPFRVTKEDEPMLDLSKIGRALFKKSAPAPDILGVIVKKSADMEQIKAILAEAGVDVTAFTTEEAGPSIVMKADGEDMDGAAVLQISEDVGLVVADLQKSFDSYAYSSTEFNVVMATEGVYPSMCVAKDALGTVIGNVLYTASSPAEAAEKTAAAIDDFKAYMVALLGAVPVRAFKADVAMSQFKPTPAEPEGVSGEGAAAEEPVTKGAEAPEGDGAEEGAAEEPVAKGEGEDAPTAEGTGEGAEAGAAADGAEGDEAVSGEGAEDAGAAAEGEAEDLANADAPAAKAIADLTSLIEGLKKSFEEGLGTLREQHAELSNRVEDVNVLAQKSDAALNGTVFTEPGEDNSRRSVKKSEGQPPLLDTAYSKPA